MNLCGNIVFNAEVLNACNTGFWMFWASLKLKFQFKVWIFVEKLFTTQRCWMPATPDIKRLNVLSIFETLLEKCFQRRGVSNICNTGYWMFWWCFEHLWNSNSNLKFESLWKNCLQRRGVECLQHRILNVWMFWASLKLCGKFVFRILTIFAEQKNKNPCLGPWKLISEYKISTLVRTSSRKCNACC